MMPTVLLFDIDGTLLSTAGAGRRAIEHALARHGAPRACAFPFAGMTDRAIVRRALAHAGLETAERHIDAVIATYLTILPEEVSRSGPDYRVHAGIVAAIDRASSRPRCAVGLGTGNVEAGARIKLARVGLAERFAFGGFGCDSEDRAELVRIGAERGAAALGIGRSSCRVVVVGDTPKDVAAAQAIGAESFAVATGGASRDELCASRPTHLFDDLAARGAIEALLR